MTRVDRYVLREAAGPFVFGVLLYSSLVILSATLPRLQWIVGVPGGEVAYWLALQLPAAVVQTLPIALLLAVLLAFGRLATSNELLALQAGGVTLRRAVAVFLALGTLAAGGALLLNEYVLPRTNALVGSVWWQLSSGGSGLWRLVRQDLPLGDYTLRFDGTDRTTDELHGVRITSWQGDRLTLLRAERARFDGEGIALYGYRMNVFDLSALDRGGGPDGQEDVEEVLRRLVRVDNRSASPESALTLTLSEGVDGLVTRFSGGGFEDSRSLRETFRDARNPALTGGERRHAEVLFHRRLAEPLANLVLLLVALPLAVMYARSRSVAFGLSLVVTLAWYLLLSLGQLLAQAGSVPVPLGVWAANLVLGGIGVFLLLRRATLR